MNPTRTAGMAILGAGIAAGLAWALWPEPVPVDIAVAEVGPLQVTVTAEGVSRVRAPYLVTAPITGTAARSPVAVGDAVVRGETVVATITPAAPALLDARSRAEAEAALREARAALELARVNLARAETDLAHAESSLARNRELAARGVIPQRMLEDSEQLAEAYRAAAEAGHSEIAMREAMLARAEAVLMGPPAAANDRPDEPAVVIRAPQSGTVLWLEDESARLVPAGAALLTIGDLADLEIEADLLSADAVRIAPGAAATVERWGGATDLAARVRRIDPRGFSRVSALGIEEQRVRVYLDLLSPPAARRGLGDAFRVFVRIVVWETDAALQVPVGALFRADGDWAVFRIEDGRARLAPVEIGQRSDTAAEVLAGLAPGQQVIAFPGERIAEGTRVAPRALR